jgi:DNA-binding NarL/FixJ family response regulator
MRVLIVDDHAGFRRMARAFAVAQGMSVVGESATGAAGLLDARALQPDLVLLDVNLPDLDGFAVAGALAGDDAPPRVVLVSTRTAADYGERLREAPVAGFISKPDLSRAALTAVLGEQPCGS